MKRLRAPRVLGLLAFALWTLGPTGSPAAKTALDDLLFDLQLVPLDGRPPTPFTLERYADGGKVSLADLKGRPLLLYFWATW